MTIYIDLLECVGHMMFITNVLDKKSDYKEYISIFVIFLNFLLMEGLQIYFPDYVDLMPYLFIFISMIWASKYVHNNWKESLLVSVYAESILIAVNYICACLLALVYQKEIVEIFLSNMWVQLAFFSKITFILISVYLKKYKLRSKKIENSIMILILINLFFYYGLFESMIYIFNNQVPFLMKYLALTLSMVSIMLFVYYLKNVKENREKTTLTMQIQAMENQMVQYKLIQDAINTEKKLKHDLKNILLLNKISSSINDQIEEIVNNLDRPSVNTPNYVLNMIINTKIQDGLSKEIQFDLLIGSDLKTMKTFDLVTVLGNLLDNAIENCGTKKLIRINTLENEIYEQIVISNSVDENVLKNNQQLKTKKADKTNHGLGLKSVKDTVNQYNGNLKINCTEKEFTVKVLVKKNNE